MQAIRLADGRIAMVLNPVSAAESDARRASLHDEIEDGSEERVETGGPKAVRGVPRAPLTLALSSDGGTTFPVRLTLDDGLGHTLSNKSAAALNRELSYLTILQDDEGTLHIAYTHHRRAVRYARLVTPDPV